MSGRVGAFLNARGPEGTVMRRWEFILMMALFTCATVFIIYLGIRAL